MLLTCVVRLWIVCMRGKTLEDQLFFDLEIERMIRRNNSKTKSHKQLAKQQNQQEWTYTSIYYSHQQDKVMAEVEDNTKNVINNNPPVVGSMSYHNNLRRLDHMARTSTNSRKAEMKTWLLYIIYANPFAGLDHEYPYTHLTKFYALTSTLGASEAKEDVVFMRLFSHSLIGKAKDWNLY